MWSASAPLSDSACSSAVRDAEGEASPLLMSNSPRSPPVPSSPSASLGERDFSREDIREEKRGRVIKTHRE
eukprot:scaffold141091_cov29-Tisochrysis_lutea.AAC.1